MGNALDLFKNNASHMTDGGTACPVVAAETGMNHIKCFHHFHNDLDKGKLGISAKERSELKKSCKKLLRVEFEDDYNDLLTILEKKHMDSSPILRYLNRIHEKRHKVCKSATGKHFTAGGISSQRSESTNSQIKERGDKSGVNKKINVFELCTHINGKCEQQRIQCISEIENLIKDGRKWSKWVHDHWQAEAQKATDYQVILMGNQSYEVEYKGELSKKRTVTIPDDGYPRCNCAHFTSLLIPCRHIAAPYSRTNVDDQNYSQT